jgi:hypothetical protein
MIHIRTICFDLTMPQRSDQIIIMQTYVIQYIQDPLPAQIFTHFKTLAMACVNFTITLWRAGYIPGDRPASWMYFTTCVQYLYISCYLSDNKPVLSYLSLCLLPQFPFLYCDLFHCDLSDPFYKLVSDVCQCRELCVLKIDSYSINIGKT